MAEDQQTLTYLVGVGVTHSIAPPMHNYVAKQLGRNWTFKAQECPSLDDVLDLFRAPTFAGGVVTMPYKISVMDRLDDLDNTAKMIGACNNVYRTAGHKLCGTNTDWRGVKGCLENGTKSGTGSEGKGRPALVIGAGGASRATIYALYHELGCTPIFVANRDKKEVETLVIDAKVHGDGCEIIHIDSVDRAIESTQTHEFPYFIVGTVPDFEPQSESEITVSDILKYYLAESPEKGVLLDMCFKPRRTRTIKRAEECGWSAVQGTGVIGHQIDEQYRLWCGPQAHTPVTPAIREGAWFVLKKAADDSTAING